MLTLANISSNYDTGQFIVNPCSSHKSRFNTTGEGMDDDVCWNEVQDQDVEYASVLDNINGILGSRWIQKTITLIYCILSTDCC